MAYVHHKVFKNLPIRYADGWIGKNYAFIVPANKREVDIEIEIPVDKVLPLTISVYVNKELYKSEKYNSKGKGVIVIKLNEVHKSTDVYVCCSKTFLPIGKDNRKLSVLVNNINCR
jgi:hypothetical protein